VPGVIYAAGVRTRTTTAAESLRDRGPLKEQGV